MCVRELICSHSTPAAEHRIDAATRYVCLCIQVRVCYVDSWLIMAMNPCDLSPTLQRGRGRLPHVRVLRVRELQAHALLRALRREAQHDDHCSAARLARKGHESQGSSQVQQASCQLGSIRKCVCIHSTNPAFVLHHSFLSVDAARSGPGRLTSKAGRSGSRARRSQACPSRSSPASSCALTCHLPRLTAQQRTRMVMGPRMRSWLLHRSTQRLS